ncbi:DoxX family protein [Chelativorans sp. AA-79]|uniref:DoxX family protein n=1 Tax=Chelativorans sp. AA-79 TaxID=3028735 RepID=UPI0023F66B5A|nr:DoxX family protein [Chelativorans sp. AA-79]WEX08481.1 DoxX family protein [Chelativorans sp. AA-79]
MSDSAIVLIGRILLAVIFIFSGFGKLADPAGTAGYFGSIGLPAASLLAWVVGIIELAGGLAILVGLKTRMAAYVLAAFTLASAFVAHFNFADQMQLIQFLKNLAITGGFLALAARGAGTISLDGRRA